MKKLLTLLTTGAALLCLQSPAAAQNFKEHISRQFNNAKTLAVYNIHGDIRVEGYAGDKITMEIDKTISGKTSDDVEQGKREFKLNFEEVNDSIVVYISEPWDSRPRRNDNNNWNRRIYYTGKLDFVIKVPYNINLVASTVNDGDVDVKDVGGKLKVHNVNGAVTVVNAKNTTDARTINGPVNVSYAVNPKEASSYYTINGNITVDYKPDLAAELHFKSMNGSYYTNFENVEVLNNRAEINKETRGNGTVYKIDKNPAVRIGGGGQKFNFETLNGNIYIKKQQ
jgi:DUF4097 and DUF4098 domain-containing protein YvlB